LAPLRIQLLRLDERVNELPAIGRTLAALVAKRLGKECPTRTEEEWTAFATGCPGIEELESRIIVDLLERATDIPAQSANHIPPSVESTESTQPVAAPEPTPAPPKPTLSVQPPRFQLEAVLNELAHEFKNPMVTIKTFAQHLDRLLGDEELRERFSKLTLDAVARMDGFLEEILRYSHFGRPEKHLVSLREAVEQALTSSDSELCERIQWNGTRPHGSVPADQEQLVFALRLLFRGFSRELPVRAPVVLTSGPNGEFVVRAPIGTSARKLQSHVSEDSRPESETSLHFAIATDLVQRNGGDLRLVRNQDTLEAHLTFPSSEAQ
jgi:two-component sensor histidine kinase